MAALTQTPVENAPAVNQNLRLRGKDISDPITMAIVIIQEAVGAFYTVLSRGAEI